MSFCCSVDNSKRLFFGSLFLLLLIFHISLQLHQSYIINIEDQAPELEKDSIEKISPNHRLKKRSLLQLQSDDERNGRIISTSTIVYPTATEHSGSVPLFPTWTPPSIQVQMHTDSLPESSTKKNVNFPHITDWSSDVPEHLFLNRHYEGNFSLANPLLCKNKKDKDLKLIILVTSVIHHFEQRMTIRLTWGHYGLRDDVAFGFVIGDGLLHQYNISMKSQLSEEMDLYGDFIIADFQDTYRNLTLKTLHMFDWVSTYCENALYFLKTDDDVFLNIPGILNFINSVKDDDVKEAKIYGHVFSGHPPKRDVSHKHHLKYDVYPHNVTYPNFTSGPAYLMPTSIVPLLFHEALKLPFIPLEDVLMNGFAAMNLGIPRVDIKGFINEIQNPVDLTACELIRILAGMTDGSAVQMNYVWFNYLMGRTLCIWNQQPVYNDKISK